MLSLQVGAWEPAADPRARAITIGLVVSDGLLVRRTTLGSRRSAELLGAEDIVVSAEPAAAPYAVIAPLPTWAVLEPARLAVID